MQLSYRPQFFPPAAPYKPGQRGRAFLISQRRLGFCPSLPAPPSSIFSFSQIGRIAPRSAIQPVCGQDISFPVLTRLHFSPSKTPDDAPNRTGFQRQPSLTAHPGSAHKKHASSLCLHPMGIFLCSPCFIWKSSNARAQFSFAAPKRFALRNSPS